ncbi:VOC family protein [Niabella hibiscisoli]|uniref:VOC family protein n=1 Tax=Niabella hibiscisoli TaxID=1825928 RepID=UPI00374D6FB7
MEAADFYTSVFPESQITHTSTIRDTPSGDCDIAYFTIWNKEFMAISAGPLFQFNPSISFMVNYDTLFSKALLKNRKPRQGKAWKKLATINGWRQGINAPGRISF